MTLLSQRAIDFIIAQEVGSESQYTSHYAHPVWPGGQSGVTIGIGYDLGQHSDSEILKDWLPSLGYDRATSLSRCAGIRGEHAATALKFVRGINIPWATALAVFKTSTLPRYAAQTYAALPNCDALNGDQFGALVSIGYNRGNHGWTMTDDRHREMAEIHRMMGIKDFFAVPTLVRGMQRLWEPESAVWKRREAEAQLFEGTTA